VALFNLAVSASLESDELREARNSEEERGIF
jgi:hypothetical protein